jgi:hypothetical protein
MFISDAMFFDDYMMVDIEGYEGMYAVTSDGEIYSYDLEDFLSPGVNKDGYCCVGLSKNGQSKTFLVHRLVAQAYIPNPEGKPQVNHIDENKQNNSMFNLEWTTCKENINHGTCIERAANTKSVSVRCVELNKTWPRASLAAKEMNVHPSSVRSACSGKTHTCAGYHWEYVD